MDVGHLADSIAWRLGDERDLFLQRRIKWIWDAVNDLEVVI